MRIYHESPGVNLYHGHVMDVLAGLPAESIHCCVTSPPYWGLRRYEGEQDVTWPCGSRCAFGNEPTVSLYVQHTVEVLRAIRRVLRDDGCIFYNIGDSYAHTGPCGGGSPVDSRKPEYGRKGYVSDATLGRATDRERQESMQPDFESDNIEAKSLCLIPERVAIAASDDGWIVRSMVVWAKTNPMPESVAGTRWEKHRVKVKNGPVPRHGVERGEGHVTESNVAARQDGAEWSDCPGCPVCAPNDGLVLRRGSWRPTRSYEYIIMLAKNQHDYTDGEDVKEKATAGPRRCGPNSNANTASQKQGRYEVRTIAGFNQRYDFEHPATSRNLRNVWTFNTAAFKGNHFATFPLELPRRCILSSTSPAGVCGKCRTPWARIVRRIPATMNIRVRDAKRGIATAEEGYSASALELANYGKEVMGESETLGFRPQCSCGVPAVPATVLDPFCGTATTGQAARELGRHFIGIDLSEEYLAMSVARLSAVTPALEGL